MSVKLRLLTKWGGYRAGDIVQFDESKAAALLTRGMGEKVSPREKALNVPGAPAVRPKRQPLAETAMAAPAAETMDARPQKPAISPQSAEPDPSELVDSKTRNTGRKAGE